MGQQWFIQKILIIQQCLRGWTVTKCPYQDTQNKTQTKAYLQEGNKLKDFFLKKKKVDIYSAYPPAQSACYKNCTAVQSRKHGQQNVF